MKRNTWIVVAFALGLGACVQVLNEEDSNTISLLDQLTVPEWFDFSTTRNFSVSVYALDNGNEPLKKIPLAYGVKQDGVMVVLGRTATDEKGRVLLENNLPDYLDSLVIRTDYPGLPNETQVLIHAANLEVQLGGKFEPNSKGGRTASSGKTEASGFTYMGTYNSQGVPNYLEPVNDYVSQDLLDLVNNSLPETRPVPTYNPQYLADGIISDTRLQEEADVWVTFVHEGAGYLNTLGYYTYDLDHPPVTTNDITALHVIFPNVSLVGSGGGLRPGNKVHLGRFPANTGIGWFLVPYGWNGTNITPKTETKYSTKGLNTYSQAQYRQHVVLLKDEAREMLLLAFEDVTRPGGDNDFNDAVFFVTANPFSAVISDNLQQAKPISGTDSDGDSVTDKNDRYPNDATKAFDIFSPGENVYGSLAFEDMWPDKGDYDMNDLVVDYNFQMVTNTSNAVVECRATMKVKALGAAYKNGFGIEFPISPSLIRSVTGTNLHSGNITLNANGTEAGQSKSVIILFANSQELFDQPTIVNTQKNQTYKEPYTITFTIQFDQPVKMADLGYAPFNPFLFVNGDRSMEVHLADFEPTDKANESMLGTHADSSDPVRGRFYKSGNNLPWAINLPVPFDYPYESQPINKTHLKFSEWAQSGGGNFKDWYKNLGGYRDNASVFKK
jgi:LruC domain-containing protein